MRTAEFIKENGATDMKIHGPHIAIVMVAAAALNGCAIGPFPHREPSKVALITAGHFYASTSFGPEISVVDVDGKPTDLPHGPIALEPGAHSVTMKCGDTVKTRSLKVAAGEVYQFSIVTTPGVRGCSGSLARIRPRNRLS